MLLLKPLLVSAKQPLQFSIRCLEEGVENGVGFASSILHNEENKSLVCARFSFPFSLFTISIYLPACFVTANIFLPFSKTTWITLFFNGDFDSSCTDDHENATYIKQCKDQASHQKKKPKSKPFQGLQAGETIK